MKTLLVILAILLSFGVASAKDYALKAAWDRNTEADMSHYVLYRTDVARAVVSACSHVNQPVSGTRVECPFTVTIADGTEVTMSFVVVPYDTSGNFAVDSDPATYRTDAKSPAKSTGLTIMLQ